jgi:hypothetical protein
VPVTYDNLWVFQLGTALLILALYGAKALVLRYAPHRGYAAVLFAGAVSWCVPVTWVLSPDWDNRHVLRIAILVGSPVATLTVPCVSFVIDLARKLPPRKWEWAWRVPLEVCVAVPAWGLAWVFFEFAILGWVWI